MTSKNYTRTAFATLIFSFGAISTAYAHDPVFGLGPHTLFKGGVELHAGAHQEESNTRNVEAEFEVKYGITGDWVAGIGTGYGRLEEDGGTQTGRTPTTLSSKYRFWRKDMRGAQESAAVLGRVILDDGEVGHHDASRKGEDYLVGLTYGYEGRKWYRWASIRHRFNRDAANGAERPDKTKVDLVVGIRFTPTEYREPDWVWMLELNYERLERTNGVVDGTSRELGGDQLFLSPGLMWTYRNFAAKAGVQAGIYEDFPTGQEADDYRALIELEWHL
ncbi:hypothetical protein [Marinobacter sp.]|uniref:hypothetical protein n=1 Tax=Marinobacter sp. TaxID=50741 RepID=UPI003B52F975